MKKTPSKYCFKISGRDSPLTMGQDRDILALGVKQPCVQAAVSPWPKHLYQGLYDILESYCHCGISVYGLLESY